MCGIVAAVGQRDVPEILLEGLRRLEYRGYDSAGLAVIDGAGQLRVCKRQGKVAALESALDSGPIAGRTGIAQTRWATHGAPSEINAHPHTSGDRVALVHNGIIENHQELRDELEASGASSSSRNSWWFSMMPLCTSAIRSPLVCGWALISLGAPWVAQRVWAIPVRPAIGPVSSADSSAATLPWRLHTRSLPAPSIIARPAES